MHHVEALKLARQGVFRSNAVLTSVSRHERDWRNRLVTVQAIEAYKHARGLPNEFDCVSRTLESGDYDQQRASILNNLSTVYSADARDLISDAERCYNLDYSGLVIRINKALYTKDRELIDSLIEMCPDMYTLGHAITVRGITYSNRNWFCQGMRILSRENCIMDILWLTRELENYRKR